MTLYRLQGDKWTIGSIKICNLESVKKFISLSLLLLFCFKLQAQYAFELEVDYSAQIQNTDQYSVSGTLKKGKIKKGEKYFLSNGAELKVINILSAATATSVDEVKAPVMVSVGLLCEGFVPEQKVMLQGINTRPMQTGVRVSDHWDKMPEGVIKFNVNGMQLSGHQISKPIYTKSGDVLDMFFKLGGKRVMWLQVAGISQIEETPRRLVCDSTLFGTKTPHARIAFLPEGFLPTDHIDNYDAYEDKFGNSSILITMLKKYTYQMSLEFAGVLHPNVKIKEENPRAGLLNITEGRVDKILYESH